MAKRIFSAGATSQTIDLFIQDSSVGTGAGLAGLVFNSAGLTAYFRNSATGASTQITLVTQTVGGAYTSGGFVEIDAVNMKGLYRLDLPNGVFTSAPYSVVYLQGATNMVPCIAELEIEDTSVALFGVNVVSYASGQAPLQPTVAGNKLDVTATGGAGIDWGNVENQSTAVNLSATTINLANTTTTVTNRVTANTDQIEGLDATNQIRDSILSDATRFAGANIDAAISSRLAPTVAGRTLDVNTTGGAGIDWGNIDNQGSTVNLSATTVNLVNTVTTVTNQLTAAAIATGVWQDATAGDFTVASSIGKALYINNIAPGASGGHFISGSNAGTTTVGALTVTGAFTVSGGITITQSTSNASAVSITGNGTGHGVISTSGAGATGDGIRGVAASTNGNGISGAGTGTGDGMHLVGGATSGDGLDAAGGGTGHGINAASGAGATGNAINVVAASTNGNGIQTTGTGTGNGIKINSVSGDAILTVVSTSGHGATFAGTGTTKHGINATGGVTSSDGIRATGGGTGNGLRATGGSTGNGIAANGGSGGGDGISALGTQGAGASFVSSSSGHGLNIQATGSGFAGISTISAAFHGIWARGGSGGAELGDGINADGGAFAGSVDIRGNLTGNITGGVSGTLNDLTVTTFAEPGQEVPAATNTLGVKIGYLFKSWRNKSDQTGALYQLYADDTTTVDQKAAVSDDGTTFTRNEVASGP